MRRKIAIAGAGIGGLAAATFCARLGHHVRLFDKFRAPAPVGSGLVVQPAGQEVLAELGVHEAARALGQEITGMTGIEIDQGRKVLDVSYGDVPGLAMHRASLFHVLHHAAISAGVDLVPDATVTAINATSLEINGTTEGPFDLILNATGANATLSPLQSRKLPYGAIWGTVRWPETAFRTDQLQQRYRRAHRMIGILPAGRLPEGQSPVATIFWSLKPEDFPTWRDASLEVWKDEATALWPDMAPFLEDIHDHDQMTRATYTHGALRNPVRGRVVHLGDAAHRSSPQLGQGANMALLDAAALARALKDPDLDIALLNYRRARRAHVWLYQSLSAAFTPQYQSDSLVLPALRDRLLFPLSQLPPLPRVLTRLVSGTLIPPLGSLQN